MSAHLDIPNTNTRIAIITGDPDRVVQVGSMLTKSEHVSSRRGFLTYQAWIDQIPLFIVATNIGAPSTAIVVEELIDAGVTVIIRLGSCGAIQPFIAPGHLIIPTGCVRDEGTTQQYVHLSYPAIADPIVFYELQKQAAFTGFPFHTGITHCKDAYYLERPEKQLNPEHVWQQWASLRAAGVLVTEMETAALFVLGSLRKVRTGAVFMNAGSNTTPESERALEIAVTIIKQTISNLILGNLVPEPAPVAAPGISYLSKKSYQKDL